MMKLVQIGMKKPIGMKNGYKWIDFPLTQISQMHQMVDHYTCDRTHYNPKGNEQTASSTTHQMNKPTQMNKPIRMTMI